MTEEQMNRVLNTKHHHDSSKKSAIELSKQMQKIMLKLKGEFIQEDGKGVNYAGMKDSALFQDYIDNVAPQLQHVDLDNITEYEKKAFFINIYNALTIHGLASLAELPQSVLKVKHFWATTCYNIGGLVYSLDDVEHGILRGNRGHPSTIEPTFKTDDPRLKFIVNELDPRIHFALVCGAKSCPAINVYSAENLDQALDAATRSFCAQEVSMFTETNEIWLSKIFQWYSQDFGRTDIDVMKWTVPYLEKSVQDRAHLLLTKLEKVSPVDVKYNEYDWSLNCPRPTLNSAGIHPNDLMERENNRS
ncbi:uncharacterized protein LOC127871497 [Dreissena polymorpha]|uniref:DUF547 domain-containing protein n=1 Tax=Dreissena polymorpha TaxID=45954 RepID=A0A9D4R7E5_DREPO|nr:uncharacterized protein LOC127871497 [Dreissena polymorpha]KAH3857774.1 hypothetical protein DPMN_100389 [Dreissena polymorpha]